MEAEAFEELPCRPVQNGPTGGLSATPLLDEPPRGERVEGLVAVHAADRLHLGAGDRLPVRDHRQRLQGGRRKPQAVGAEVRRDLRRVLRGRHDLPLVAGALKPEPGALVRRRELRERVLDRARRSAGDATELASRYGLLRHEQDRLDRVR